MHTYVCSCMYEYPFECAVYIVRGRLTYVLPCVHCFLSTVMFSQSSHSEDMIVFLTKLNELRKYSTDFLRMLNDMRRRLKELPTESSAAKSYRCVFCAYHALCVVLE